MESAFITITGSKPSRKVDHLICVRCAVQSTREGNSVCELCKALGKNVDPVSKNGIWSDVRFGGICAKRFIFGLKA